jgi:hypothetical protein
MGRGKHAHPTRYHPWPGFWYRGRNDEWGGSTKPPSSRQDAGTQGHGRYLPGWLRHSADQHQKKLGWNWVIAFDHYPLTTIQQPTGTNA